MSPLFRTDGRIENARTVLHSCIKGFTTGHKTLGESVEGGEGKASLSSDYNLLFKNKIGESPLDIHRIRIMELAGCSNSENNSEFLQNHWVNRADQFI